MVHAPLGDRCLQVNCAGLRDAAAQPFGAIAVLNDVTRLKALEEMRREFVANVSHEIKTPVTSIKGFAETLLDGALGEPEEAERFSRIIVGQADRLNSIVEDLLALSSVEQSGHGAIDLQEASVTDVLQVAAEVCQTKALEKDITIELLAPEESYAAISPPLLEQAVVNLVDNAIKYSPPGGTVTVSQTTADDEVIVAVEDRGCGISREHLPHLFERFYRVDKARSRELGGTGLGLAIVKHIAQAHGGHVSVESSVGSGSTFSIHLPRS
jgi:two-component system phosphate regulon sensor histidine kinase PhoR